jgi:uncharacterized protein YodC (DUF2158 family)
MAQYAVGDKVKLKSGGPIMTVDSPARSEGDSVHCQWFSGSKLQSGFFNPKTLEPADDDDE